MHEHILWTRMVMSTLEANVIVLVLLVVVAFHHVKADEKRRLSTFPEECSAQCEDTSVVVDLMIKPRMQCPDTIEQGNGVGKFIGNGMDICRIEVCDQMKLMNIKMACVLIYIRDFTFLLILTLLLAFRVELFVPIA